MIPVEEAIKMILAETHSLGPERVGILQTAGRILAGDVFSDIDMPPFDKSSMDGYALKHQDVAGAPNDLEVVGLIPAGVYPDLHLEQGQAAKIMTGAPLPSGADSVQMVEKTEALPPNRVKILEPVQQGKHVAKRGEIMRTNAKVLSKGAFITPSIIGVLATVGKKEVEVFKKPEVGILITGDELVTVDRTPKAGQIRNSNGYVLYHQVRACGAVPELLGIAPDDPKQLTTKILSGLKKDVLLITGGVSMGDLDFVEDVFAELGVRIFFDKMNIKPGKPSVFGKRKKTLVFGLPGNPVSASTIFELIARPALRKMMGLTQLHNIRQKARLQTTFTSKTKRENFAPAWTSFENSQLITRPIESKGSADVLAFAKSNSYIIIPSHVAVVKQGQEVEVMLRDEFWKTCNLANSC
ncbi:MAG: gephyrin-like molybdotransferase Glp [bacterium]